MEREKKKSNHIDLKVRRGEGTQSWITFSNLKKSRNYRGEIQKEFSLPGSLKNETKKQKKARKK